MKYIVNARFLTQKVTGVQRYAMSCSLALQDILGDDVIFIAPKGKLNSESGKLKNLVQIGILKGHIWEQLSLPRYIKSIDSPFLFCFCGLPPILYTRSAYCIHDMAVYRYPKAFKFLFGVVYRFMTRIAVKTSTAIFCVSKFTKSEIFDILGFNEASIVSNTLPHSIQSMPLDEAPLLDNVDRNPYILCVGSLEPRKNLDRLIAAFLKLNNPDLNLVIIGSNGHAFKKQKYSDIDYDNIKFQGYVSDKTLKDLYSGAMCFVYPSVYEGFGIPPLEAMANNCPVLTSNCSSMPEVCGDAALYFNPFDIDSICNTINDFCLLSIEDRNFLILKGRQRLKLYSSENQTEQLKKLVSSLPS